jgi:hypothetical protein
VAINRSGQSGDGLQCRSGSRTSLTYSEINTLKYLKIELLRSTKRSAVLAGLLVALVATWLG